MWPPFTWNEAPLRSGFCSENIVLPIVLAVTAGAFNQLTGINACLYYLNDIFAAAGASKYSAGMQSVIIGCTNLMFTIIAMTVIDMVGRKKLLLFGTAGVCVFLAAIGTDLPQRNASGLADLAGDGVHGFLRDLARCGGLGVHQRSFPDAGSCQRSGNWLLPHCGSRTR